MNKNRQVSLMLSGGLDSDSTHGAQLKILAYNATMIEAEWRTVVCDRK